MYCPTHGDVYGSSTIGCPYCNTGTITVPQGVVYSGPPLRVPTLEERVAALEAEVAALKEQLRNAAGALDYARQLMPLR